MRQKSKYLYLVLLLGILLQSVFAQPGSRYIVVDQFGYLPGARKVAVIRDPQEGFDADESFQPGTSYSVVESYTGDVVLTAAVEAWKSGATDESSGDRAWHFDFSSLTEPGTYYILDEEMEQRSYDFVIAHNVYNEVLKQAARTFYYQRVGFPKEAPYADDAWVDGASHVGDLQDLNCRSFFAKDDPSSERDVSGGWYDAGDYNKYTSWTANYVVELMLAYLENSQAWGDDYNIPESGNGIPDILDEARWGILHLLRLQNSNGSMISIVGEDHGSPPSSADGPSYYGKVNTSASLNTAGAFALAYLVYEEIGDTELADTLLQRALLAWEWADANPSVIFKNNVAEYNSVGLGAGQMEEDDFGRSMGKLQAACFLFDATSETRFRDYFDAHYTEAQLMQWTFAYPYQVEAQEVLLYYTEIDGATASVKENIRSTYRSAMNNNAINLPSINRTDDPYMAFLDSYVWGSNGVKASKGLMYRDLIKYSIDPESNDIAHDASSYYIHYLHGVNPLAFVYLSNMYAFGAERGVNEFYHSWFTDGSSLWDRTGTSVYGPAPGYLTGGANPGYDRNWCCPSGCGSSYNNSLCNSINLSPPLGQPAQKSYKDFNNGWPLDSWSVTENSCGYQVRYLRLLSHFVVSGMDCNGDIDGGAFIDSCGHCAGGNTGLIPELDPEVCVPEIDCEGVEGGVAFLDSCGICSGGNTGREPVLEKIACYDCNNEFNGEAFLDACGTCAGGNTGIEAQMNEEECYDCNGEYNGSAL